MDAYAADTEIAKDMIGFRADPLAYAMYNYPWNEPGSELEGTLGPREWQRDTMEIMRAHLSNPLTRFDPLFIAVASGHGIGKSALIGMLIGWGLDTMVDTRIVCTANTDGQLRSKTSPEVGKWRRMSITKDWFLTTTTRVSSLAKGHDQSWRCDFIPWSEHNTEAFAGLHNKRKRIIIIYDEASGIVDKIWEVTEGALTDEDTEIIWIAFGNPTRNSGRFRECFRKYGKLWHTRHIDSRTVEGTNKKFLQQIVDQYGEDSDVAKIRVRGQFPDQSAYQLFNAKDVSEAQRRVLQPHQFNFAPVILTLDNAWSGDDEIVFGKRQGLDFVILEKFSKNDNDVMVANKLMRYDKEFRADAVFIDAGYGTGVYSIGLTNGYNWQLVWFGGASPVEDCVNKRSQMYVDANKWLKSGGSIPHDNQDLYNQMTQIETVPRDDGKYQIMSKEQMRELIGESPGETDALVLSFAHPVAMRTQYHPNTGVPMDLGGQQPVGGSGDYNPYYDND